MDLLAKVYPDGTFKTIKEHTEDLLKELERLNSLYRLEEEVYTALKIACLFHDLGKASSAFQKKIYKTLGREFRSKNAVKDIPHNFLSGAFLYAFRDAYDKGDENIKNTLSEMFEQIFYAVSFHHDRKFDVREEDYIKALEDIEKKLQDLEWLKDYGIKLKPISTELKQISFDDIKQKQYKRRELTRYTILIKGLLHRIDHCASAQIEIEQQPINDYSDRVSAYLVSKGIILRDFQRRAKELCNENVLLVASTGLGKTEFAKLWINGEKAFYTLPVRVSVNAMYERFKSVFGEERVGLLHSYAKFYELERSEESDEDAIRNSLEKINFSRHLSMPITITTADQLFTSVFKFMGFERIYATLSYSKIVVDEPQGYSPKTLAYIVKAIKEIKELGGRFLVMTATLHPFLKKELSGFEFIKQLNTKPKHKIRIVDKPIDELKNDIIEAYSSGKRILVILNTVRKAQELYLSFKEAGNIKLLHSLFISRDRAVKEAEIQRENQPVIWITTQIVEASLDIDYDILFTEAAPIDSLIQRMGRVYRRPDREIASNDEPNVVIAIENPSGKGNIYDSQVLELTVKEILNFDGRILTEEIKQSIMDLVYDPDKAKSFFREFKDGMELLNLGFQAEDKRKAEEMFREIFNFTVIPYEIYQEHFDYILGLSSEIKSSKGLDRVKSLKKLYDLTLSAPLFRFKRTTLSRTEIEDIFVTKIPYEPEIGLNLLCKELEKGEFL
ncbi:MAG: CRISPR-associated helicase Cas3' [Caldimicrobium sp.]|nr:CRISPR-associated helicase Cas3' [Caldimicrobium sp.]